MMRATRSSQELKVGELARRTGVSVRTLHHYDEIGLLRPSHRTASGHRLYAAADVVRLQQIRSLRQLGFSLDEVGECLRNPAFAPRRVLEMHVARLEERIARERRLALLLTSLAGALRDDAPVSVDDFIHAIEEISAMERYYTPEQIEQIKRRGDALGPERIAAAEREWPELIAQVRAEMARGTDPADARVQAMARRWKALVDEFTGGDAAIARSVMTMYENEPAVRERHDLDPEVFAYVGRAMRAAGLRTPGEG